MGPSKIRKAVNFIDDRHILAQIIIGEYSVPCGSDIMCYWEWLHKINPVTRKLVSDIKSSVESIDYGD